MTAKHLQCLLRNTIVGLRQPQRSHGCFTTSMVTDIASAVPVLEHRQCHALLLLLSGLPQS